MLSNVTLFIYLFCMQSARTELGYRPAIPGLGRDITISIPFGIGGIVSGEGNLPLQGNQ